MTSVILSRLAHAGHEELGPRLAERLGFDHVGREELLGRASRASGIPADRLQRACAEGKTFFGMSARERRRCVAHIQAALSGLLLRDGLVYEGRFGHVLLQGVSHLLKVRITAPLEVRAQRMAAEEGVSPRRAERILADRDRQRNRLSLLLFSREESDPDLFDLVVDTSREAEEDAVERIAALAREPRFAPMTYSRQCLRDLELAHRVKAVLADLDPEALVFARKGEVEVRTRVLPGRARERRLAEMRRRLAQIEDVAGARVEAIGEEVDLTP